MGGECLDKVRIYGHLSVRPCVLDPLIKAVRSYKALRERVHGNIHISMSSSSWEAWSMSFMRLRDYQQSTNII